MKLSDIKKNESLTIVDDLGKLYICEERVFRIIEDPTYITVYENLLNSGVAQRLFDKGLVFTTIPDDIEFDLEKSTLVLEHSKIDFILQPCEYSNYMYWESTKMFVELMLELAPLGLVLKDAHPWNISYHHSKPVFFDFCSIVKATKISIGFVKEFRQYYGIPLSMSNSMFSSSLGIEYRKEHGHGFGLKLYSKKRKIFSAGFLYFALLFRNRPTTFLKILLKWVEWKKPKLNKEYWSTYDQGHGGSFLNPETIKQKFVWKVLADTKPKKVIDLASNKGYFAAMSAHLGAQVIALDYEDYCIDQCLIMAREKELDITPGIMNFMYPTPSSGWLLLVPNAFDRFRSDIVLALGLIHHVCLTQKYPVKLFCETCLKYATSGVIMEFVHHEDIHVAKWKAHIPEDYSIDSIREYMKSKFPNMLKSEPLLKDGVNRIFLYFY